MPSLLFVHGTGVRRMQHEATVKKIRSEFQGSTVSVEGCLWGDALGVKLHAGGLSIPKYHDTGGEPVPTEEEIQIELWMNLYEDPLYEIRVLGVTSPPVLRSAPGQPRPGDILDLHARQLSTTDRLREKLEAGDIIENFDKARLSVLDSPAYTQFFEKTPPTMAFFQLALARAIVAGAMALHREMHEATDPERHRIIPAIETDVILRDEVVELVREQLGPRQAAVGEYTVRKLLGAAKVTIGRGTAAVGKGAATLGTSIATWRRGRVADASSPIAGDILLYQSRGDSIRELIRTKLEELTPPIILVGHSLGGIACVDLLIDRNLRDRVPRLITVGSQAPFFYEINALNKLEYGKPLPDHVPEWTNVFDLRDLLSFVGEGMFPGRVKDVVVDNRQPFPQSHSAYWSNPKTFSTIKAVIASL
jgi:hypothetical protein